MMLPIHGFSSTVYHSSITVTQADELGKLQARGLKTIYGYNHSYRELLEQTGLARLADRRQARADAFVLRSVENLQFASRFPRST